LRRAHFRSSQREFTRPQGRLRLRRLPCRHDGGLGSQLFQPGAQVRSPMTLAIIGVNHKTAPIALRERIAIGREELPEATRVLAAMPGVAECMIVSTCNRVELVAVLEDRTAQLSSFLTNQLGLQSEV